MERQQITEILDRPLSRELLDRDPLRMAHVAGVHAIYDGMVRIVITPTWATLIDFQTNLPSAVEELIRREADRASA